MTNLDGLYFGKRIVLLLLGCVWWNSKPTSASNDNGNDNDKLVVTVEFFGESQCPYCREFVRDAWPAVWEDKELMQYVRYDFFAWGNSYFSIPSCSQEDSYDRDDRACWYKECIEVPEGQADDDCFAGDVIYQHSEKEGQVDIYEMCVKLHYGLDVAVDFTYCCEGPKMDDSGSARDLLLACSENIDPDLIHSCFYKHGHIIEVWAAKHTPTHPGVPYVLVDGQALSDPFSVRKAICERLIQKMSLQGDEMNNLDVDQLHLPSACNTIRNDQRTLSII